MGRRTITFCIICQILISGTVFAQKSNVVDEINNIKSLTNDYLYAESTTHTWNEALDNAKFLLGVEIEMWAKEHAIHDVAGYIAKAQKHIFEIKTMRGDMYRAFVYVNIKDIMTYKANDQIVVVPVDENQESTISQVSEHVYGNGNISATNSVNTVQDGFTSPVNDMTTGTKSHVSSLQTYKKVTSLTPLEKEILTVSNANGIKPFLKSLLQKGDIISYGRMKDLPTGSYYVFVFNENQMISAYLKKTTDGYVNLETGTLDNINNYKGCGAIWFKKNNL